VHNNKEAETMATNGRPQFDTDADYSSNPVSEGPHACQITECSVGKSKKGKDMLTLNYRLVGPNDEYKGEEFKQWIVLVQAHYGFGRLQEICKAIGVIGIFADPEGLDPFEQESRTLPVARTGRRDPQGLQYDLQLL
jgi:hypothetical protein